MALCGHTFDAVIFETVRYLSEQEQERYCVSSRWNCCICSAPRYLNRMALSPAQGCPVSHSLLEVKAYIQTHLSDKLTIAFPL